MKSMLFIVPWSQYHVGVNDCDFKESPDRAPEGVVGLASYLQAKGARVKIADMQHVLRMNGGDANKALDILWKMCQEFNPDVIGFSFFTARFESAKDIFCDLRSRYRTEAGQAPPILGGGVHPTLLPQQTFEYIPFDSLVLGEGELPLERYLNGEPIESIKGFCVQGQTDAQKADAIANLDEIPFPDWSLIDIDYYTQPSHQLSRVALHRAMPVTFGRSCVYRCNFCAHNCFLHARVHSADYFIAKMHHVAEQTGVDTFIIQDSSIGNFRSIWQEVCHKLITLGSPYKWWANLRANQCDEDFLSLLKQAGCIKLFFGFESGSQRILDRMGKRITVDQCRNAASLCHKIGIPFYTSYIVNYFGETEDDLRMSEELIMETRPSMLAVNRFSPIPGSIDYNRNLSMIAPHIRNIRDWTMLGMLNSPLLFGDMKPERFDYWYKRLRSLKAYINSHETPS